MKPKLLMLLFFATSLLLVGCNKSEDDGEDTAALSGIWHLNNVSGGFAGVDVDYNRGEVIWNFNLSTGTLSVENNLDQSDPNYAYAGLDTGNYDFQISEVNGIEVLMIEGTDNGEYIVTSTTLTIDDRPADGFLKTFER
jgi:hypothetical protein